MDVETVDACHRFLGARSPLHQNSGPRRGTLASGRGWPLSPSPSACSHVDGDDVSSIPPRQVHCTADVRAVAIVAAGRRFVPPGERPSAGVTARKGRERPRLRIANAAPGLSAGSLTPHMSVSLSGRALGEVDCVCAAESSLEVGRLFPAKVVED